MKYEWKEVGITMILTEPKTIEMAKQIAQDPWFGMHVRLEPYPDPQEGDD